MEATETFESSAEEAVEMVCEVEFPISILVGAIPVVVLPLVSTILIPLAVVSISELLIIERFLPLYLSRFKLVPIP